MKKRILYIAHNHPSVRPGGAEAYALELYEAMKSSPEFEPIFLAKGGPPMANIQPPTDNALIKRTKLNIGHLTTNPSEKNKARLT